MSYPGSVSGDLKAYSNLGFVDLNTLDIWKEKPSETG